jgi:hypothetical protein
VHSAVEATGVDLSFRSDGGDDKGVANARIERAPRAAAGTRPQFTKASGTTDIALVRVGKGWSHRLQFLDGGIECGTLGQREAVALREPGGMEDDTPHNPSITPALYS